MSHYDFLKTGFTIEWYLEHLDELLPDLLKGIDFIAEENERRKGKGLDPIAMEVNTGGI